MNELEALAAAVALEHQVVYGYGVAGAHLGGAQRRRARAAYDRHRLRRDQLATFIAERKGTVPAAAPAYALPFPVTGAPTARELLARLEDACAGAAWDLTAAAPAGSDVRRIAVRWLTEAATAAASWRSPGASAALPGHR